MKSEDLSINLKNDIYILAELLLAVAFFMMIPLAIAYFREERSAQIALFRGISIIFVTILLMFIYSNGERDKTVRTKDGYFIVTMAWVLATFFGCIPLYLSGWYSSFWSALFESMSGFTTTGATMLDIVEAVPSSLLFWRCESNWLGGMGIVILFVAVGPMSKSGGMKLLTSESVGPTKDKLTPKSRINALSLWVVYVALSILQVVFLLLGGLDWYDSVTITFSTMSAAGFSTRDSCLAEFSNYVKIVTTIFMFLSGINFALFFKLAAGRVRETLEDGELKSYILITFSAVALMTVSLTLYKVYPLLESLLQSSFHFISLLTTTGFVIDDYVSWPQFPKTILFFSMLIGGCAGSAGGGAKVIRVSALVKVGVTYLRKTIHPTGVFPMRYGNTFLSEDIIHNIAGFCGLYYAIGGLGTLILSLVPGVDLESAASITFLCLGNIGAGVGQFSNLNALPEIIKVFLTFLMLIGRLEIFTVFALFSREFWHN